MVPRHSSTRCRCSVCSWSTICGSKASRSRYSRISRWRMMWCRRRFGGYPEGSQVRAGHRLSEMGEDHLWRNPGPGRAKGRGEGVGPTETINILTALCVRIAHRHGARRTCATTAAASTSRSGSAKASASCRHERVAARGGSLTIDSRPGKGTEVSATPPT